MNSGIYHVTVENRRNESTSGPQTLSPDEGKARVSRGRVCLVLMTVSLGLICVLLLVFIIWQNISITAERDLVKRYETTVQEFNHTINSLQTNYSDLSTEKDQLQDFFNFVKLELETRISNLTIEKDDLQGSFDSLSQLKQDLESQFNVLSAEKNQLQGSFDSLSQKKLELESTVTSLSDQLNKETSKQCGFFMSKEAKSWSESWQYCRDRGADLVMIKTEDKQRCISSFVQESVWIGLNDIQQEASMKWVDNSALGQKYWANNEPNDSGGNEDRFYSN